MTPNIILLIKSDKNSTIYTNDFSASELFRHKVMRNISHTVLNKKMSFFSIHTRPVSIEFSEERQISVYPFYMSCRLFAATNVSWRTLSLWYILWVCFWQWDLHYRCDMVFYAHQRPPLRFLTFPFLYGVVQRHLSFVCPAQADTLRYCLSLLKTNVELVFLCVDALCTLYFKNSQKWISISTSVSSLRTYP